MIVLMTFLPQADGVARDSRNAVTIDEHKGILSEFAGCCIELARCRDVFGECDLWPKVLRRL